MLHWLVWLLVSTMVTTVMTCHLKEVSIPCNRSCSKCTCAQIIIVNNQTSTESCSLIVRPILCEWSAYFQYKILDTSVDIRVTQPELGEDFCTSNIMNTDIVDDKTAVEDLNNLTNEVWYGTDGPAMMVSIENFKVVTNGLAILELELNKIDMKDKNCEEFFRCETDDADVIYDCTCIKLRGPYSWEDSTKRCQEKGDGSQLTSFLPNENVLMVIKAIILHKFKKPVAWFFTGLSQRSKQVKHDFLVSLFQKNSFHRL